MFRMIKDECPERDGAGMCHCKRVSHTPLPYKEEPCYPENAHRQRPKKKTTSKKTESDANRS